MPLNFTVCSAALTWPFAVCCAVTRLTGGVTTPSKTDAISPSGYGRAGYIAGKDTNNMETKNAFLAIFLSMAVLFGYQYLFPSPQQAPPPQVDEREETTQVAPGPPVAARPLVAPVTPVAIVQVAPIKSIAPVIPGRSIKVETNRYSALFGEEGGTIQSFRLKNYREKIDDDSDLKELISFSCPSKISD